LSHISVSMRWGNAIPWKLHVLQRTAGKLRRTVVATTSWWAQAHHPRLLPLPAPHGVDGHSRPLSGPVQGSRHDEKDDPACRAACFDAHGALIERRVGRSDAAIPRIARAARNTTASLHCRARSSEVDARQRGNIGRESPSQTTNESMIGST
jgi:hypothetical protein